MKKTTLISLCSALLLIIIIAAKPYKSSTAAPPSHTGAPSEQTCATSGCHDDNKINKGSALLEVKAGDGVTKYIAGTTYPIKIKITDTKSQRFGFQIVALGTKSNQNIGSFKITDVERTQIVKNAYKLQERTYVTYTFNGTDEITKGIGEWTVNWTAPENTNETVSFYVAAVSGNDDMSDKGDMVYTKKLMLK